MTIQTQNAVLVEVPRFEQDLLKIMWDGDSWCVRDNTILFDIRDYIATKRAGASSRIWWDAIADYHVTDSFRTLNSLTQALFELHHPTPIGLYAPPLGFIETIYRIIEPLKISL